MQHTTPRQNTPSSPGSARPPWVRRAAEWLFLAVGVLYALWELRHFARELRQRFSNRD